jgi:small subunit ribosomal protein S20
MANTPSAEKRIRQNAKRRARNRWRKTQFRDAIKQFNETLLHGSSEDAQKQLQGLYKLLDQVAAGGTIHKNTADRYKSRLALRLNKKSAPAAA